MTDQPKTGQVFDIGPDGYAFVREVKSGRTWPFPVSILGSTGSLIDLHGRTVEFRVDCRGQVEKMSLAQEATAVKKAKAAAASA